MRSSGTSLLESIQGLLERTYGMRRLVGDIGCFIVGDRGYRDLYRGLEEVQTAEAVSATNARTLIREGDDGLRVCIYYPDALIRRLESEPPQSGLRVTNVDAFAALVEELDHLLCIAERSREDRPVSMFELELHANVSKHLVLSRFLAGRTGRLGGRRRTWLRYHLFEKGVYCDEDPRVRARYRDSVRWTMRFLEALESREATALDHLRAFHRAGAGGKVALIRSLAA